jgi:hypothetical protein
MLTGTLLRSSDKHEVIINVEAAAVSGLDLPMLPILAMKSRQLQQDDDFTQKTYEAAMNFSSDKHEVVVNVEG